MIITKSGPASYVERTWRASTLIFIYCWNTANQGDLRQGCLELRQLAEQKNLLAAIKDRKKANVYHNQDDSGDATNNSDNSNSGLLVAFK